MKIIRKENGISQKMMAEKLNLLPTAYSNYENHFTDIPVEIMQKFCKEIGCSMEDLIGFDLSNIEDVHPITMLSDLVAAIMELNKKDIPVRKTLLHIDQLYENILYLNQKNIRTYDALLTREAKVIEKEKALKNQKYSTDFLQEDEIYLRYQQLREKLKKM